MEAVVPSYPKLRLDIILSVPVIFIIVLFPMQYKYSWSHDYRHPFPSFPLRFQKIFETI